MNELKVLAGSTCKETSGAKLVDGGVAEIKSLLSDIMNDGGGVLFIDEAYQLDPQKERSGRLVLEYLLTELENHTGTLVVVFAGYQVILIL